MAYRTTAKGFRVITRKTFTARLLGLSEGASVDALRQYLFEAQLTPTPTAKLDLVMVEDAEHLADLMAEQGIPLARQDPELEQLATRRTVTLQRRTWIALFVLGLLPWVDDLSSLVGLDILPWW